MAPTERACLVIADISGYTGYLAGVELDHAQDVLADLINTVVRAFRPAFKLAKLEGDAAFVYALAAEIDGSILLDDVEGCYFAFRQRLLSIRQASTCECNACSLIPSLNLKLVVHHGTIGIQKMAGRAELVGADVIVVHRLLKNSIEEPAYAFITDECIGATALDPTALGMRRHVEEYEHIGKVAGWVEDLERAWTAYRERKRVYVSDRDAVLHLSAFQAAPAEVVWEYISSPILRPLWSAGMDRIDQLDPSGRRRPGTMNHCMHGKDVILQEFLDWRPPRYYTSKATIEGGITLISTHEVEPVEGGSIVHDRFQRPKDKSAWPVFEQLGAMFREAKEVESRKLAELLASHRAAQEEVAEPDLPQVDEEKRLATGVAAG
ncbi:MAG: DUF2652 domain-containing protein [Actinomycetota bacterium]